MASVRDDFDAPAPGNLLDPMARLKLDLTDIDNAERLWSALRDDAVYVDGLGWLVWDGVRFNGTAGGERMTGLVGDVLRRLIEEEAAALARQPVPEARLNEYMAETGETDRATAERKVKAARSVARRNYARQCGNLRRIRSAIDAAKKRFLVDLDALDADRSLLQVANGTLRLEAIADVPDAEAAEERLERWRAALVDPPDRASRPTRASSCRFDPGAEAPEWRRFIELIMPDAEMRLYLQTLIGLTLFGQEGERVIFLLGQGANGKSTLVRGLREVWGGYAESCRIEMFCEQRSGPGTGPTPEEAVLPGARVYVAAEPDASVTLSAAKVKGLTGGDERQANPKNKALFTYTPVGVPILSANKMPQVNDPSRGFWRRVFPVLFDVSLADLPEHEQRTSSEAAAAFRREAAGILNWALEGWVIYRLDGIRVPARAAELKASLQALADPVGEFLRECTRAVRGARVRTAELYTVFGEWVQAQGGGKPISNRAFVAQMLALDHQRAKSHGNWYWRDLELAVEGAPPASQPSADAWR